MQAALFGRIFRRVGIFALTLAIPGLAASQTFPTHTVRMVVPFSAGAGVTDIMARLVAKYLTTTLGQGVVVDNCPGAGGIAGSDVAATYLPDGHPLLVTNVSHAVDPYLYA